jgi:hypothetical protein
MNHPTDCTLCFGTGEIRITDYIDHKLCYDWSIECPLCAGIGVIHTTYSLLEAAL